MRHDWQQNKKGSPRKKEKINDLWGRKNSREVRRMGGKENFILSLGDQQELLNSSMKGSRRREGRE